ncbi:VOC family protein [Cryptosporangium phraense]|uniref:VOC family protein n=1 Tax=Cryptosporangium phraense TaxID=2593070 RepID=A0A545AM48_9ACTN|nr:VOC family protein [Cryptosporangium phraense]TQS42394.1 VOC family protein [Cryptosporangium phraense]
MELSLSHTFVVVDDQDEALAFYRDLLGLVVKEDLTFGPNRWLSLHAPNQPDVEIVLETPAMRLGPDAETFSAIVAKGNLTALIFTTDDCGATFERLAAAGAEVVQEPVEQSYGVRDCAFRDPSGNAVRFSEYVKKP